MRIAAYQDDWSNDINIEEFYKDKIFYKLDDSGGYDTDVSYLIADGDGYILLSAEDCSCWRGNYEGWYLTREELEILARKRAAEDIEYKNAETYLLCFLSDMGIPVNDGGVIVCEDISEPLIRDFRIKERIDDLLERVKDADDRNGKLRDVLYTLFKDDRVPDDLKQMINDCFGGWLTKYLKHNHTHTAIDFALDGSRKRDADDHLNLLREIMSKKEILVPAPKGISAFFDHVREAFKIEKDKEEKRGDNDGV